MNNKIMTQFIVEKKQDYLLKLEQYSLWNLRIHNIYISHTYSMYGYKDVKDRIIS